MANDKLIYAGNLADVIRDDPYIHGRAYARVRDHIEEAPAVDAVEVVLCGQCKFSDTSMSIPCAYICRKEKSPCYKRATYADFGCLYGERRTEKA